MKNAELIKELQKWSPDAEVMMRVDDVELGNKNVAISHVEQKKDTVYLIDDNVFGTCGDVLGKDWGFTPEQVAEREKKEDHRGDLDHRASADGGDNLCRKQGRLSEPGADDPVCTGSFL